jgi:hypothetical protein
MWLRFLKNSQSFGPHCVKTQFITSVKNSYMFRHQSVILRDSSITKEKRIQRAKISTALPSME